MGKMVLFWRFPAARRGVGFAAMTIGLVIAVVACAGSGVGGSQGVNVGNRARDFVFQTLDGQEVSLSDYRGQVVLVNFWATWCPPCRAEIPDLEAAYQDYRDEGFVVLGVNVEEPVETIRPFVEEIGISYPILLDEDGEALKIYRAIGLPMSLILDQDGVIQVRHAGTLTAAHLENYLGKLLP
jgi:cytochrome c biogenesis protein CcmG/thiol:disulfide interchange protein DsbE